jgi:hypothetical protein
LSGAATTTTGFAIALVIILTPTLLLTIVLGKFAGGSGALAGALIGFTLGTGLGYFAGIVPQGWVFIAVLADLVMLFILIGASRGSRP